MNEISTTGWIVIILLGGLIIGINLSLLFALRGRNRKSSGSEPSSAWQTLKNPWDAEDREWNKLAEKVKHLPTFPSDQSDQKNENGENSD